MTRPTWDQTYMDFARRAAQHSHDPATKVGAVIVGQTLNQIALGVNGRGRGRPNERMSDVPGESGMAHAEQNALAKMAWQAGERYTLYVTHAPCTVCASLIINSPITRVVYGGAYRDLRGLDELRAAGIEVSPLEG